MNSALEIASYVINKCNTDGVPISNLQLQKILYCLQRNNLQIFNEPLFADEMEAWMVGPVVPKVYEFFCGFAALPIKITLNISSLVFEKSKYVIINIIIEEKRVLKPWDLVSDIHAQGKAWDITFRNGRGDHFIISKELIKTLG